jgi:uncharacterized UPF0160 family protein
MIVEQRKRYTLYCIQHKDQFGRLFHRTKLKASWAGKARKELCDISGFNDAIFCHLKRFMLTARSLETCKSVAEIVLEDISKVR